MEKTWYTVIIKFDCNINYCFQSDKKLGIFYLNTGRCQCNSILLPLWCIIILCDNYKWPMFIPWYKIRWTALNPEVSTKQLTCKGKTYQFYKNHCYNLYSPTLNRYSSSFQKPSQLLQYSLHGKWYLASKQLT